MISDVRDCSTLSRTTLPTRQTYRATEPCPAGRRTLEPPVSPGQPPAVPPAARGGDPRAPRRAGMIVGLTLAGAVLALGAVVVVGVLALTGSRGRDRATVAT